MLLAELGLPALVDNLVAFCYIFLSHLFPANPSPLHHTLAGLISMKPPDGRQLKVAIMAFRGSGKSSWISVAYVLHQALFGRAKNILLVSESEDLALEWLRTIRDELETNPLIRLFFGTVKGKVWTDRRLILANKVRIKAIGIGAQIRGRRPDLIICDDIESRELARTPLNRRELKTWFWNTLRPALHKHGRIFVVGTAVHRDCLLQDLVVGTSKLGKKGWIVRKFPASSGRNATGTASWPAWMDLKELRAILEDLKSSPEPGAYAREFDCEPVAESDLIFHPKHLRKCSPITPEQAQELGLFIFMTLDPALGEKERNDPAAYHVAGVHTRGALAGRYQILDLLRGRWGFDRMLDIGHTLYLKWYVRLWIYEGVGFQNVITPAVRKLQRDVWHHPVRLLPVPTVSDKLSQAQGVQYLWESGLVYWPHDPGPTPGTWGDPLYPEQYDQITSFPEVDHDDDVDAMVKCLRGWEHFFRAKARGKKATAMGKKLGPVGNWQDVLNDESAQRKRHHLRAHKSDTANPALTDDSDPTGLYT